MPERSVLTASPEGPEFVPFAAEEVGCWRAAGIWGDSIIPAEFSQIAAQRREHRALCAPTLELTFGELDELTDRVALGLAALGLQPGERVLLQLANYGWTVIAWYALLKAGLVPVATLAQHRSFEIDAIARQCAPAAHLVQRDFPGQDLVALARATAAQHGSLRVLLTLGDATRGDAGRSSADIVALEDLRHHGPSRAVEARAATTALTRDVAIDALAVLQLSGGTTSIPKLIPRLHAEYWYNARAYAEAIGLGPDGGVAHLMPVVHNAGIVCGLHAAHAVGACFAVCPYEASALRELAGRQTITHMLLPPALAKLIQGEPGLREALGGLRAAVWVLGQLETDVLDIFERDGCRVLQMFGMGEGLCMATPPSAPAALRHSTVGTPISPYDEVRVLEPGTEKPVALGERGELCCRGPYTIRGYFRAPDRNAEAFTSDGFYRTGDLVSEVRHGASRYFRLEDRIKDLINRGGEKINAAEIEELLVEHPAVARAALVAMPDPRLGERPCAYVVLRPGASPPELYDLCAHLNGRGVAKYKWPERMEVRERLPLTNIDKVDKAALRADIATRVGQESGRP